MIESEVETLTNQLKELEECIKVNLSFLDTSSPPLWNVNASYLFDLIGIPFMVHIFLVLSLSLSLTFFTWKPKFEYCNMDRCCFFLLILLMLGI